jgi:hypothetical protein
MEVVSAVVGGIGLLTARELAFRDLGAIATDPPEKLALFGNRFIRFICDGHLFRRKSLFLVKRGQNGPQKRSFFDVSPYPSVIHSIHFYSFSADFAKTRDVSRNCTPQTPSTNHPKS